MSQIIAFDIYGTLIDTAGIGEALVPLAGERAALLSSRWRGRQLEYSFRRGLMGEYENFTVCTRDALDYSCRELGIGLPDDEADRLMAAYRRLPAFAESRDALQRLAAAGHRLFAFSNGPRNDLEALLGNAGLLPLFLDLVSVDEIRSFKPDPRVYRHFLSRSGAGDEGAWLVSGNSFDLVGAAACGFRTAWVRRSPDALFDSWGKAPTLTVSDLSELADRL
ncbi:MAG TPA: haloacid dehalogenase type II [Sedimenticola thiotaurini]|uniref:(S)-2-haloacid dehalogenase n=1 Tax=Sedimenticola thiotaurini TaxID=1543721 RepID=A0A831RRQ3_9GAMM|nr:haloacid dehalogenase type II [Sedimenticola thiotaurini]